MIKKKDLLDYFWKERNLVTTREGVELALHGDDFVGQGRCLLRRLKG